MNELKKEIEKAKKWLHDEYVTLRTGRATPAILDKIMVDSYGTQMPINQVASITTEGPRSIKIVPWDKNQNKNIEKAINDSDLGVSVNVDDTGVRVNFPELTTENRENLLKVVNQKHEDARVSVKMAREGTWEDIQKKEKNSEITEDEKFKQKEEMEKLVQDANKELKEMYEKKEKEILET